MVKRKVNKKSQNSDQEAKIPVDTNTMTQPANSTSPGGRRRKRNGKKPAVCDVSTSSATVDKTPTAEAPIAEAPIAEAPVAEAPTAEIPIAEAPSAKAPFAEASIIETLTIQPPITESVVGDASEEKKTQADTKTDDAEAIPYRFPKKPHRRRKHKPHLQDEPEATCSKTIDKGEYAIEYIPKEQIDKEFAIFNNLFKEKKLREYEFIKIREIQGNLFDMPETYSLGHCVAEDMNMGSGIAVQFSQKFRGRGELYQQRQKEGGMAFLEHNGRYIYYLVTKKYSNAKPTTYTMWCSLQKMRQHVAKFRVRKLAIPRIGCGLDRLDWTEIKAMVEYTFRNTNVDIIVCNYNQKSEDASKEKSSLSPPVKQIKYCPLRNVRYPLVSIDSGTAIIYFGTVNGYVSEDVQSLDNKFKIIAQYQHATKNLGDVIHEYKNQLQYSLFGCITRLTENDPFDFISFEKCIVEVKKINKNHYTFIAIQAFHDNQDELLLKKVVNVMRFSLIKVVVYVCWGDKMLPYMPVERGDF